MALLPARAFAVLSGIALIVYLLLPYSSATVIHDLFQVAPTLAVGYLLLRGGLGRGRGPWILFGLGNLLWVGGNVANRVLASSSADGFPPFPSSADAFFLLGYPLVAIGLLWGARLRSPQPDPLSMLDGVMVAAAAAVPVIVMWVSPALDSTVLDGSATIVALLYPASAVVFVAVAVRLVLGSGTWSPAAVMLVAGLFVGVLSDMAYNVALINGTYAIPDPLDLGWLLSHALWTVAILHPSARGVFDPGVRPFGVPLRQRLAILVAIVALPLTVVAVAFVRDSPIDAAALLVPLAVISCVMVLRLRLLARTGSRAWRAAAVLAAAAFIVVAGSIVLTQVHARTEQQETTSDALVELLLQAERLDGEAARTLSAGSDVSLGVWHELSVERIELTRRIDAIVPALTPTENARVGRLGDAYLAAVKRQVDLVHGNLDGEAAQIGQRTVLPAHTALISELRQLASEYRGRADRSGELGRIGTVLVLLASLFVLTGLLLKYGGMSRAASFARERNRAARESEQRLAALVGGSADILTVIEPDTSIARHAESAERVLGYPADSLLGTRFDALLRPGHADHLRHLLEAVGDHVGATETLAFQVLRADGTWLDAEARIANQTDDPLLGGFVLTVRDISDRKQLEAELEHQAFHDPLTGLANRGLIVDRLRQALARGAGEHELQSMVLIDIDDFKAVNDSLGHGQGDDLLREIARRLSACVRSQDTLARVGGDAFALLIEDAEAEDDALRTADRMLEALQSTPVALAGSSHMIRASIGVAVTDGSGPGSTTDQSTLLLRNAELAMYEAKRHDGGSIEVFEAHMHDAVTRRLELKAELARALQDEEFSLVYQPIVDIAERRIVGYEALVRWIHPERGMISPGDFIPIAEQTGLIVDLGTWVLREACRQLAVWQASWKDARYVSVNVAGHQLQREDFTAQVRSALADSGLAPSSLLLEMTESSLIQDTVGSERRINELRGLGVRLAIDDFGTGYSSLSYLHRFSVDVLKIDKSFIDRVTEEGPGSALVDAIVNMASSLGLRVVAEGIEEAEQVLALAGIRCEFGQGYHYSRPLPVGDVGGFELAEGPAGPAAQQGPLRVLR